MTHPFRSHTALVTDLRALDLRPGTPCSPARRCAR